MGTLRITISGNQIDRAVGANGSGIFLSDSNSTITITDNCITSSAIAGIVITASSEELANFGVTINGNNISCNGIAGDMLIALLIDPGALGDPTLDASGNYFGPCNPTGAPISPNNVIVNNDPEVTVVTDPLGTGPADCPAVSCCPTPPPPPTPGPAPRPTIIPLVLFLLLSSLQTPNPQRPQPKKVCTKRCKDAKERKSSSCKHKESKSSASKKRK